MDTLTPINRGQIIQVPNMRVPKQGAQALAVVMDFSSVAGLYGDLRGSFDTGELDFVQSIWIDNSDNANSVAINFPGAGPVGQTIIAQPNTQGFYPMSPQVGDGRFTAVATIGMIVPVTFYNIPVSYFTWGPPQAVSVAGSIVQGVFVQRSSVIAAAGVSQQLVAANANRKRLYIFNPGSAAGQGIAAPESLFIGLSGAAAGVDNDTALELFPGGFWDSGTGPVPTNAVTVNGATINHAYIAFEM